MAFVNQYTTDTKVDQKIKVLKVLCQECLQEVGDLTIPAPANLTLDLHTGKLNAPVTLEVAGSPQIRTVKILMGKVILMGVVPVRLEFNKGVVCQSFEVPFQSVVHCSSVDPEENVDVQKHDVQVEGLVYSPVQVPDHHGKMHLSLIIKAVVKLCVIVSREDILKVEAASQFCACP
ncbi:DUF3794 domain-containing protein [Desulfofalx alkaliphila]|uniref:DUF3794 domain-containing protein n=1 Tax=Desulfofalx alkaliphila TaxID=105483 RepID=UPI0004E22870|nr:DUF3794 domain-containing protein [Desulfofalx alkaliphila]